MFAKRPKSPAQRAEKAQDKSAAPPVKRRSLDWVRQVLGHQIRPESGRKQQRVAVVEPKRGDAPEGALPLVMQQCAEIGARLLIHDPTTQPVRHLFILHDELRNGGWEKVAALPLKVIDRALTEAEILDDAEPSPILTTIVAELREQKAAAEARAAREAAEAEAEAEADWEILKMPEVSDTNFDEYELMERSWAGTVPAGLELPTRDTTM
jgi:hypothetical protein